MKLGAFSMSLSVKDLSKSVSFYKDLGFRPFGGNEDHGYVIMKNGDTLIGLFQGMFEGNLMTFNPGWDQTASAVDPFDDCLLYTSPSPRDQRGSRMPSSA